ncbi:tRNA guanosine(34) transglycosylase Tgt [Candidatus Shapirobacteria bacterium CG03_land_8_20_14_0_80_40_19]|uniref:Queuine tRNA-ribosyltransferase n=3 Tax=Candidatus Shapironibacteriota TaxID=1752721 RepID=A0A2M7BF19_9BACT|nr:MAG: tRNA guanosine(34) transglycosylase Tgt [Candidatus Shapirobacteria bacterium CG11_big_fil_rev_8_21_14_0_20_40_12]PIV01680.1 MAG: tRNA guanosine(34) transglycosylase Tgt [Candidatus Shapirobacteria bacterium CG03_land_8_20_14_0_80_40_19]PJC76817.1 MAG: tRNA guanosine(34) transglycosylase Tgt [Candidatus Shapirobacteria bacterium CG_4_8_14_3_um_filter_39_11]
MERKFNFKITARDKKTQARIGIIYTAHGKIKTPAFVPVGTQASVKSLDNRDLAEIGSQLFFANTYHLYLRPGIEAIKRLGGLHSFTGWTKPLISDSAGFQVFSLNKKENTSLVKIKEDGVSFRSHLDGSSHFFTPEKSIKVQIILGADIMIAFDECTFYPASHEYSLLAMERTHRWAVRSLKEAEKRHDVQALYGVVQGGVYKDLRQNSAEYINGLPFEGTAIGGVSVGESKKEMVKVLDWTIPKLSPEKPRHLLGVGEISDIFELVQRGIDSFDCVMPTRLGRMGFCLTKIKKDGEFLIDLNKSAFAFDEKPIEKDCKCFVCKSYCRAYLHHLFRTRELLAYRLASYHNLWFIERLVDNIREAIDRGEFLNLKKQWLGSL